MASKLSVHLAAPFKVSWRGYYVDTACGTYYADGTWIGRTEDRDQVTCRKCQRTYAFREVTS